MCSNCVPMATSFKLDPHEYLTLAPGLQRVENELFLEGFAIAPWKPLALVMNRQKVYVVLSGQNKWLSITWSFSRLPATYLRRAPPPKQPSPFQGFSWASEGLAANLECRSESWLQLLCCLWTREEDWSSSEASECRVFKLSTQLHPKGPASFGNISCHDI